MVLFFVLAFAISWGYWFVAIALGISLQTPAGRLLETAGNFGPLVSAFVVVMVTQGLPGVRRLGKKLLSWQAPLRWYLAALLGPFGLMILAIVFSAMLSGPQTMVITPAGLLLLIPAFIHTTFLAGGLNEETGWRGFALPGLLANMRSFRASLLLGLLWGLWHTPLYFMPGTGQYEMVQSGGSFIALFAAFIAWTIGLSILFTWLNEQTRGNLFIAILFHASINTAAGLPNALGIQASLASFLYPALTWVAALLVARQKPFMTRRAAPVVPDFRR